MVLASLREAGETIRKFPSLFILGFVAGLLGASTLVVQFYGGMFFSERVGILQLLILPFFIGGALFIIRKQEGTLSSVWEGGKMYYLRILLATVVILFASIITLLALIIPLTIIGIPSDAGLLSTTLLGVLVPIVYFTLFYDAAIVFEERKVLDSLRRSVEFVITRGFSVLLFIVVNLFILAGIVVVLLIVWTIIFASQLEPLVQNLTLGQPLAPEALISALGPIGIIITAFFYLLSMTLWVTLFFAYKACFFRRHSTESQPVITGEFDEKGRWYKY